MKCFKINKINDEKFEVFYLCCSSVEEYYDGYHDCVDIVRLNTNEENLEDNIKLQFCIDKGEKIEIIWL